jgi:pentatricopeptide repeat protein
MRPRYNSSAPVPRKNPAAIQFNKWLYRYLREENGSPEQAEELLLERVNNTASNSNNNNTANNVNVNITINILDYNTISFNLVLNAWARQRSTHAARRADALLQILLRSPPHMELKADTYSYGAVLNAYAKSGGNRKAALRAEQLLYQMECSMKVQTDICHNAVMDCWSVSGDEDAGRRAQRWLTTLEEGRGPRPTRISYNACIKAWARSKNNIYNGAPAEEAHKLLERMQRMGGALSPDKISYSTCIDAYCRSTTNLTVAAEQAEALLQQMEDAAPDNPEMRPDVVAYTSVLYAYAKAGIDTERAMALIGRMERYADQKPNTTFLNTLIHLFAKASKVDHAEALLKTMVSRDMADKISYTAVISAHAKVGNATRALELVHELESLYKKSNGDKRFLPTAKTFASVLHAISKSKDCSKRALVETEGLLHRMVQLHRETNDPELLPNTVVHSQIFLILSNSQDPSAPIRAQKLMEQMKQEQVQNGSKKVRPDAATYAYLINTFTKSRVTNSVERATKILEEVEQGYEAGDDSLKPTKLLYSAVLQAYAKSASPEGADLAEALLKRTIDLYKKGKMYAKPTKLYYNAVMDAHARSKRGRVAALRAEELLKELETRCRAGDSELAPTTRSYNAAILAWKNSNSTDAPQRAEALLKRMNARYGAGDESCRPDRVTINSIISVWAKCRQEGASERAETFLKFMENLYYQAGDTSLKPDSYSFNSVIDAYSWSSSTGAAHRAEALYNRMKSLYEAGDPDLQPDIVTLTSLRNAWARSGDAEAPRKLKRIGYLISKRRKQSRLAATDVTSPRQTSEDEAFAV